MGLFSGLLSGIEGLFGSGNTTANSASQGAMTALGEANPNVPITQMGPSAFNSLSIDPSTRASQMAALDQYQQMVNDNGLDPAAKAQLQSTLSALAGQSTADAAGITDAAERRGVAAGGSAAAQRAAAANDATQANDAGLKAAALAFQNKNAALSQGAQLAGTVKAQDYDVASQKATANDKVAALNTQLKAQQQQQNYQNQLNKANLYNNIYGTANAQTKNEMQAGSDIGDSMDDVGMMAMGGGGGGGGGMTTGNWSGQPLATGSDSDIAANGWGSNAGMD